MKVLFDGEVHVHYGFLDLLSADAEEHAELMDARAGQSNGLVGAAVPGQLSLVTGLHTGRVPLVVQWHDTEPPIGDQWEEVIEVSFQPAAADLALHSFEDSHEVRLPAVRSLRVRYCAAGMDAARDADTILGEEPTVDRYLLALWPAEPAPEMIVRQTSDVAASWHREARETPDRQPDDEDDAPQPDGNVEILSPEQYSALVEERLRSVGGPRAVFGAWSAETQRDAARWLARRSLEIAGLDRLDWFGAALDALDRGDPLPEPITSAEAVFPLLPPGDFASAPVGSGAFDRQPSAVSALVSAAAPDPLRAVIDTFYHAGETFDDRRGELVRRLRRRYFYAD